MLLIYLCVGQFILGYLKFQFNCWYFIGVLIGRKYGSGE